MAKDDSILFVDNGDETSTVTVRVSGEEIIQVIQLGFESLMESMSSDNESSAREWAHKVVHENSVTIPSDVGDI